MSWIDEISGLTSEQKTQIEVGIQKLEAKRDEILDEKKSLKKAFDNLQNEFEQHKTQAVEAEENAKLEAAKKDKDIEKYESLLIERDNRIREAQEAREKEAGDRARADARNEFLQKVSDDPAHRHFMSSKFDEGIDYKDGQLVTKDGRSLDEFMGGIVNNKDYAQYIKQNVGSGGSATGSTSSGGAALTTMKVSEWAALSPQKQAEIAKPTSGIKIIDD